MSVTTTSLDRIVSADIFTTGNGDSVNAMLSFKTEVGVAVINIHGLPPSVARATADAFNEATEEHRQEEERRKLQALYEGEKAAGLHKPQDEIDADLRDAGRGPLVRLLRMDPVQMKEANDMAQKCDVVAEKLRDDI